jgi:hypothetical protein
MPRINRHREAQKTGEKYIVVQLANESYYGKKKL